MSMMDGAGTTDTNRAAGGGLAEIGVMLRRRREEVGQDLAKISATTHIKQNYLKAIEDGRRKDLPGTAYMIGYIRTYADYLGFDGNRLITDYHADLAGQRKWVDKRADPVEPAGISLPQIQVSPVILLAGLLMLGIGIFVGWGYATAPDEEPAKTASVEPPAETAAPETEPVEPAAKPVTPSPTGAEAAPADVPAGAPTESEPAGAATKNEPVAASEEALAADQDQVPPEADIASAGEQVAEESPPQQAAAEAEGTTGKIVVRARLESWIQVTNDKKEVLFSRVLRSGETYTVPDEQGLMLTTGNAGGIEILVNGTKLKSLGTVGLVKRDIPLDPKKLKDGSAFKTSKAAPATN
jgi:cytoskeleton protein RodZ